MHARMIRHRALLRACLTFVAIVAAVLVPSADAQTVSSIAGVVTDSAGAPIFGAHLEDEASASKATTDEQGMFRLVGVPTGTTNVVARRLGFAPASMRVQVAGGGTSGVVFRLAPLPALLAPVSVRARRAVYTGRLAGYYERLERRSGGAFITREQIDRENPMRLTHIISRTAGVSPTRMRGSGGSVRMRGRGCWPLVWLDGSPMPSAEVDLDTFSPQSIHGVELYLGATSPPARYTLTGRPSMCGTILLWSRGADTDPLRRRWPRPADLQTIMDTAAVFTADRVDVVARRDASDTVAVTYPPSLAASGVRGSVLAEFVVDTLGRVEPGTVSIASSTHRRFTDAVRDMLDHARYAPAQRAGQRVRQIVLQPFVFIPLTQRAQR